MGRGVDIIFPMSILNGKKCSSQKTCEVVMENLKKEARYKTAQKIQKLEGVRQRLQNKAFNIQIRINTLREKGIAQLEGGK